MSAFLKVLPALVLLFALESLVSPAKAQAKHKVKPPRECSLTSTNYDDCILTVRRGSFVALPPIQMAPGKTVTVEIDGARPSESYSLDQAPGSAAAINDVATSTFTDLQTVLGSATALLAAATAPLAPPPVSGGSASRVRSMKQLIEDCDKKDVNNQLSTQCILVEVAKRLRAMADAAEHARHVYQELTFLTSPDAQPNSAIDRVALLADLCGEIRPTTDPFPCELTDSGANPILYEQSIVSGDTTVFLSELALPPDPKFKDFVLPKESQAAINLLKAGQKSLDAMRTDLEGYAARLSDLQRNPADLPTTPLTITDTFGSASFLARTETRKLNILNLISNSRLAVADPAKKNLLVSITVVYGRTYVEGSYGVAFALRPIRTFTIAPTVGSGGVVSSYSIGETKAGPEVVPFVTASVAPFHDFAYPWSRWRGAIYASGGIGYNTSQESADLFVGPSLSWRGLLFSAFCDFGHASRLSQGLTNGESLGATTSLTTLPTENYWAPALAFAVSVRIPGITGR